MAFEQPVIPFLPLEVDAAQDLRLLQHHAVIVTNAGVILAPISVTSGPAYILANKPNSGEPVSLSRAPNVVKAHAGGAIVIGNTITVGTSGSTVATSYTPQSAQILGQAMQAATGSGNVYALALR